MCQVGSEPQQLRIDAAVPWVTWKFAGRYGSGLCPTTASVVSLDRGGNWWSWVASTAHRPGAPARLGVERLDVQGVLTRWQVLDRSCHSAS
jgi:hypothetical protein